MTRKQHAIYDRGVQAYLNGDNRGFLALRKSFELNTAERALLHARQLLKQSRWNEALASLENISCRGDVFLEGEKHFLLANAFSYKGEWQQAINTGLQALSSYQKANDRRMLFLSHYNLSVDFARLGLDNCSDAQLEEAKRLAADASERVMVARAQACAYSRQGNSPLALLKTEEALRDESALDEVDRTALQLVAADIYFRHGNPMRALYIFDKLLFSKVTRHKARVLFNHQLIKNLLENEDLPSHIPKAVKDCPEYHLKWTILLRLQAGDQENALAGWSELMAEQAGVYGESFRCLKPIDEKSPFMVFLHRLKQRKCDSPALEALSQNSKLQKLLGLLSKAELPLRKESLIEQIWHTPYAPEFDGRFYKLVERLKKLGMKLENRHQAYRLKAD